jgi:hypothetical protein
MYFPGVLGRLTTCAAAGWCILFFCAVCTVHAQSPERALQAHNYNAVIDAQQGDLDASQGTDAQIAGIALLSRAQLTGDLRLLQAGAGHCFLDARWNDLDDRTALTAYYAGRYSIDLRQYDAAVEWLGRAASNGGGTIRERADIWQQIGHQRGFTGRLEAVSDATFGAQLDAALSQWLTAEAPGTVTCQNQGSADQRAACALLQNASEPDGIDLREEMKRELLAGIAPADSVAIDGGGDTYVYYFDTTPLHILEIADYVDAARLLAQAGSEEPSSDAMLSAAGAAYHAGQLSYARELLEMSTHPLAHVYRGALAYREGNRLRAIDAWGRVRQQNRSAQIYWAEVAADFPSQHDGVRRVLREAAGASGTPPRDAALRLGRAALKVGAIEHGLAIMEASFRMSRTGDLRHASPGFWITFAALQFEDGRQYYNEALRTIAAVAREHPIAYTPYSVAQSCAVPSRVMGEENL